MLKAVIFDLDGVLIDSVPSADRGRKELLARHGINIDDVPDEHGEGHRGTSVKTFLAAVKKSHGIDLELASSTETITELVYQDLKDRKVTAGPSLVQFLEELKARGVMLAITSSAVRPSLNRKLELLGIADYFPVIISAHDAQEHKPDPAPYVVTIQRLGIKSDECIVFEDSTAGIQSGEAAGALVIGFAKYTSDKLQPKSGVVIRDWTEISYPKLQALIPKES